MIEIGPNLAEVLKSVGALLIFGFIMWCIFRS